MENENRGRQFELDIVKFFAIPFMVCIHFYEQFGIYDFAGVIPDTVFRNAIEFAGGPLAAPVFMFCMGIGMIYTKHASASDFIRRGCKLLLMGYALNFMRQTLPQLIGLMIGIQADLDVIGGLLCVDILPFAGMTFLTVGVLKRMGISTNGICMISFLIQAAGILIVKLDLEPGVFQNLLGLLVPTGKWTSFPLSLWFVYPAMGMIFGEKLLRCLDKAHMYRKIMIFMSAFLVAYTVGLISIEFDIRLIYALYGDSYYHHTFIGTIWIMPIILLSLAVCYLTLGKLDKTPIGRLIRYCGKNLNTIYVIQWLVIAYSVAFTMLTGAGKSGSPYVIVSGGIIVTAASILLSIPIVKLKRADYEDTNK